MVITPNSDVILLKCPLELDQENQLNFANATTQYNYFYGLNKYVAGTKFTYQCKDGIIRIPAKYDDLISYNYVMYRNDNYSNKWFYAFIEKMEYINDGMTSVKIKTDVFQTWQFDLTYKRTFVEREHVNDDTIGKHTIPEGLDLGEPQIVDLKNIPMYESNAPSIDWIPCFVVSKLPPLQNSETSVYGETTQIGGVLSSFHVFAVTSNENAQKFIRYAYENSDVTTDSIINIYMIPRCCVHGDFFSHTVDSHQASCTVSGQVTANQVYLYPLYNFYQTDQADTPDGSLNFYLQQPVKLAEDYTPVNNKLYTSPYSYVYMSNNAGEDVTLDWADFPITTINGVSMPAMAYRKFYVPSVSVSAKLVFSNYKTYNSADNDPSRMFNYGISFGKLPVCAWTTDYYTNWLTQNGVNVGVSMASSIASMGVGVGLGLATGGIGALAAAGGLVSGFSSIAGTVGEMHRAATTPPQAHGDLSMADLTYCFKRNSISCYYMSVRKEVAQVIDSYFSMYGYKVNTVKVPNITGRTNWNFVKTVNCYIDAGIPQEDLQEIKDMFNRGLTIWHNPATFMDYSQSNTIVS